ncbi:MAG: hypothetical protein IJN16_02570 [Lachnospiraceae bacterium]|nr:hypothetical protein [Lachnospiraceae bacterium]
MISFGNPHNFAEIMGRAVNNRPSVAKIPTATLNPHEYEDFIILQANISTDGICISGFEHPSVVGYERNTEVSRFSRHVSVDIFSINLS